MYVDTGQGTVAQRLDNPTEPPLGDALPRHNLDRLNTSNELLNKNKNMRLIYFRCVRFLLVSFFFLFSAY